MPTLISEEMGVMSSVNESDDEPMSTKMLEDICDGSQSHPIINRMEAPYKVRDIIKRSQAEWKGFLLYMLNMNKGLKNYLRLLVMRFCKFYQFWLNLAQKFLISFQNL